MALTSGQQVRLRIQDLPVVALDTYAGDGQTTAFKLPHNVITSASAYVGSGGTWNGTGATFVSGYVAFADPVPASSAFMVKYTYSVFSDDEVEHFLTAGGNVNGAAIEAVQTLMFDGLKRQKWSAPDGTEVDDTAAMKLLTDLYKTLKQEQRDEAIVSGGGFQSWAENQELY